MTSMREQADAISKEPGFWPNYSEPTPLARAVGMPLADPHWQNRVLNGYAVTKQRAKEGK